MKKLETTITIQKPAKVVWDYMNNPDNMPLWLDNFEKYEHVSGEYGQPGSKGIQYYNEKGRKFSMDEEVLEVRENEYIRLSITSKQMDMIIENTFKQIDDTTTEFTAVAEFTRVSLVMKIMMKVFMPHKKAQVQHDRQMQKLKELVEAS